MTEQLKLAKHVASILGLPPTWPNLRTIEIALICETAFSSITLQEAADLILLCARCPLRAYQTDKFHLQRYFPINRFWFEDGIWRETFAYAEWRAQRPDEVRRRAEKEAAEQRRRQEIMADIVGECTGCRRPRHRNSQWTEFCADSCREDYERRVARRDRLANLYRQAEGAA